MATVITAVVPAITAPVDDLLDDLLEYPEQVLRILRAVFLEIHHNLI